ncbi:MAG: hypothetical protein IJ329_02520 [Clostridia bacterium]|nr:hypothetical protein [Clostridia bacterium]
MTTRTDAVTVNQMQNRYTAKERTPLEELRALDKEARRPPKIFAYVYGAVSSLVLGSGMCLTMKVVGTNMALGIGVGLLGIALCISTYPIYKVFLQKRKNKYAKQIFELSDSLLNKNNKENKTMGVKQFFKDAFSDMKESAKAQHEVDKANLEAVKAESKANFEENKFHNTYAKAKADAKQSWDDAHMSPAERAAKAQEARDKQIAEAKERTAAANARYEAAKKN